MRNGACCLPKIELGCRLLWGLRHLIASPFLQGSGYKRLSSMGRCFNKAVSPLLTRPHLLVAAGLAHQKGDTHTRH